MYRSIMNRWAVWIPVVGVLAHAGLSQTARDILQEVRGKEGGNNRFVRYMRITGQPQAARTLREPPHTVGPAALQRVPDTGASLYTAAALECGNGVLPGVLVLDRTVTSLQQDVVHGGAGRRYLTGLSRNADDFRGRFRHPEFPRSNTDGSVMIVAADDKTGDQKINGI